MNACCPKCGAEYQLGDNLLGCKVECSVCHQKFIVGDQKSAPQNPVSLRCPKLLKFISILYIGLGAVIVLVSSLMCVDIAGDLHWFGGFWGMLAGVAVVLGSYFFLVGRRLGRAIFAIGILLGVVNKSIILPTLLCLPLGLSFGVLAREWFARCAEVSTTIGMQFVQNLVKLKLWMKLLVGVLLGLYVLVFLYTSMVLAGADWRMSRYLVSAEAVHNGEWGIVMFPLSMARDGGRPCFGIYPQKSMITIAKGGVALERFDFDDGAGLNKCKEWVRTNFPVEAAVYINKYLDEVCDELGL